MKKLISWKISLLSFLFFGISLLSVTWLVILISVVCLFGLLCYFEPAFKNFEFFFKLLPKIVISSLLGMFSAQLAFFFINL